MSDLEKRVEHWLEYGKEYRWSNEFMTFLSDVKTAFLAPREEEPEIRLKRYETTIDGEYVTVLKSALEWLESVALAARPVEAKAEAGEAHADDRPASRYLLRTSANDLRKIADTLDVVEQTPSLARPAPAEQQLQGEADELISEYAALREGAKEGT